MSWDSYIVNLIAQTKDASSNTHCDRACIIGKDGNLWTSEDHANALKLTAEEMKTIGDCFTLNKLSSLTNGFCVEGAKYQFLREEDGKTVYAKKKGSGAITLQASKTAVVIGHCPEGGQQGNLNKGVNVIAEYLESLDM